MALTSFGGQEPLRLSRPPGPPSFTGHTAHGHGSGQAGLSRRQFLRLSSAGAAGVVTGSRVLAASGSAWAGEPLRATGTPKPIPQFFEVPFAPGARFHLQPPATGSEPSTITDFVGRVAVCQVRGNGTANDGRRLPFDVDMRLMSGLYLDVAGRLRHGTFAFV